MATLRNTTIGTLDLIAHYECNLSRLSEQGRKYALITEFLPSVYSAADKIAMGIKLATNGHNKIKVKVDGRVVWVWLVHPGDEKFDNADARLELYSWNQLPKKQIYGGGST